MKTLEFVIISLVFFVLGMLFASIVFLKSADAEIYICGVPAETYIEAPVKAGAGAIVSIIVHELSHVAALKLTNTSYEWGTATFTYNPTTKTDDLIISNAGFAVQTGLSILMKRNVTPFRAGFIAASQIEILSYKARRGETGDLSSMNNYGYDTSKVIAVYGSMISTEIFKWTW